MNRPEQAALGDWFDFHNLRLGALREWDFGDRSGRPADNKRLCPVLAIFTGECLKLILLTRLGLYEKLRGKSR